MPIELLDGAFVERMLIWLHHPMNIHAVRQIGRNFVGETEAATREGKKFPMKRYSLIILLYIKFLFYPDFSQNGNNR